MEYIKAWAERRQEVLETDKVIQDKIKDAMSGKGARSKVAIIVLNWNGWRKAVFGKGGLQ